MFFRTQANIVSKWEVPDTEMVQYRSFKPFFPLLDVSQDHAVQLWAAWAIHHVFSKSRKFFFQIRSGLRLVARDKAGIHQEFKVFPF